MYYAHRRGNKITRPKLSIRTYYVSLAEKLLHRQYPWAWIILLRVPCRTDLLLRHAIPRKYKNENINTVRSLGADRIEQDRIFMLLSRTEAIGSVTFV